MTAMISDDALTQVEILINSWETMIGDAPILNESTHTWISNEDFKNFVKVFRTLLRSYTTLKAGQVESVNLEQALKDLREEVFKLGHTLKADLLLTTSELRVMLGDVKEAVTPKFD